MLSLAASTARRSLSSLRPSIHCHCFSTTASTAASASSAPTAAAAAPYRVCIVGSGPAGFYAAKYLLSALADPAVAGAGVTVDMVERLPTPFGLVRSGVAPDHQDVKTVQNDFAAVAADARFAFHGNVEVGRDVSVAALRGSFDAVVMAHGAADDRHMGVEGEETLAGVVGARSFVNWYNGHPDFVDAGPDLTYGGLGGTGTVVVVGNGNVAIDCARILTKSIDELATSDIKDYALDALRESCVEHVILLGRRGHPQASFTIKELRELSRLDGVDAVVHEAELEAGGSSEASQAEIKGARARKRIDKLLWDIAKALPADEKGAEGRARAHTAGRKTVELRFLSSPEKFTAEEGAGGAENAEGRVAHVHVANMALEGEANAQWAVPTGETEVIPAGLVLRSIGYKSVAMEGVAFDEQRAIAAHEGGRVDGGSSSSSSSSSTEGAEGAEGATGDAFQGGLYAAGWFKRGPSGIVGTNIACAKDTVATLIADLQAQPGGGQTAGVTATGEGEEGRFEALVVDWRSRVVVGWTGALAIDAEETQRGEAVGKPREKIVCVDEMLETARGLSGGTTTKK